MPADSTTQRALLTVREAAATLGVSDCWVRRHAAELPVVKLGRLVRFDSSLLARQVRGRTPSGNGPKPEGKSPMLRRWQSGHVYKAGRRVKVWYGMYREDVRKPDGSFVRRQHNIRLGAVSELPTRTAAQQALVRVIGKPPSVEITFRELVERWEAAVVPTLQATSADFYKRKLRSHAVPVFGERPISAIGRFDVESFLAEQTKMYCRNTIRGMRASMSLLFSWAVACGWLEKNPCSGVKLPQAGQKVKRTVLRPEQVLSIAGKLEEPYATLILFLAVTGLRISEAVGIRWDDFDGDTLHVCRRIYEGKTGQPKTKNSDRFLPIPAPMLERMQALGSAGWVFQSKAGTPVNPGNALKRYVQPAARKLEIPLGGWHDFRHTLVTHLRRRGWAARVVADIVGHASPAITEAVYTHSDRSDFRAALDEIAAEMLRDVTKCTGNGSAENRQVVQ